MDGMDEKFFVVTWHNCSYFVCPTTQGAFNLNYAKKVEPFIYALFLIVWAGLPK